MYTNIVLSKAARAHLNPKVYVIKNLIYIYNATTILSHLIFSFTTTFLYFIKKL